MAEINGTEFGDKLKGTKFDDVIDGLLGDDKLSGGDGDDILFGVGGADSHVALGSQGGVERSGCSDFSFEMSASTWVVRPVPPWRSLSRIELSN